MPDTVTRAPDDGRRYHPKHVEQFTDINKLYIVASCWIIIDTYYASSIWEQRYVSEPIETKYFKFLLSILIGSSRI